jgi:hypothetical protein
MVVVFFFVRSFFELQDIIEVEIPLPQSDDEEVVVSDLLLTNTWDSIGAVTVINGVGTGVVAGDGRVRHSEVERDGMR